jgi:hypothetical protein
LASRDGAAANALVNSPTHSNTSMFAIKRLIALCLLLGGVLWILGASQAVYTDPSAPRRLANDLAGEPRETRGKKWSAALRSYETPRKKLTDMGRGILAVGFGGVACFLLTSYWPRIRPQRRHLAFCSLWLSLWITKAPLSWWYYLVRYLRHDYPTWGDSIAVPVMQETVAWMFGAIASLALALLLMAHHTFAPTFKPRRPANLLGWLRAALLACWGLLLLACIFPGIIDGDEGMVFPCLAAMPLLMLIASAEPGSAGSPATAPVCA